MSVVNEGNLSAESQDAVASVEEEAGTDRRAFLTKTGTIMSVFALIGLAGSESAEAQSAFTPEQATALSSMVDEAMAAKSSDRKAIFTKYEKQIPSKALAPFKSLTDDDWKSIASLAGKLKSVRGVLTDNYGVIGM